MGIEGLAVAALLISVKASQKLKIYYINRALSKLNCYALYLCVYEKINCSDVYFLCTALTFKSFLKVFINVFLKITWDIVFVGRSKEA